MRVCYTSCGLPADRAIRSDSLLGRREIRSFFFILWNTVLWRLSGGEMPIPPKQRFPTQNARHSPRVLRWRPEGELNPRKGFCRPLPNHSAIRPRQNRDSSFRVLLSQPASASARFFLSDFFLTSLRSAQEKICIYTVRYFTKKIQPDGCRTHFVYTISSPETRLRSAEARSRAARGCRAPPCVRT